MLNSGREQHPSDRGNGFAIIVVLASLLILTTVFAIASQRSLAHVQTQTVERTLAQRQFNHAEVLTALLSLDRDAFGADTVALPAPFDGLPLRLQDVGGLVDLNTAAPELLTRLLATLGAPDDAAARLREWRRTGQRLQRVDDLIRIAGLDAAERDNLLALATVHSGRQGIAAEVAPDAARDLAGGLPQTAPSLVNFAVYLASDTRSALIGVISIPTSADARRILEMR